MVEGDIFRWHWKDGFDFSTWCCSPFAKVEGDGVLRDMFWSGSDNKTLSLDVVDLEFLGNLSDYKEVHPFELLYYDNKDYIDLRHSNNSHGPCLLKKGAKKSKEAMAEELERRLENCQRNLDFEQRRKVELLEMREKLGAGKIDEVWL